MEPGAIFDAFADFHDIGYISPMQYLYLHGFNGGWPSRSGPELARLLDAGVYCPQYDYSRPFDECRASLTESLDALDAPEICLMGTSLGGFYALSLRHPSIKKVVAWNPVVYPASQLLQFVGLNVRFNDGVPWIFARETALSYAKAPDPRVWRNLPNVSQDWPPPERRVIVGDRDEILDSGLCVAFWEGWASVSIINSGHSIENYSCLLEFEPDLSPPRRKIPQ